MDPGLVRVRRLLKMFVVFAQVSWVRHRDVHLLTVATYTYTADQRFRAVHKPYYGDQAIHPDSMDTYQDWVLEIHSAQQRDSGIYECQISTTPHQSLFLHVRVVGTYTDTAAKTLSLDPSLINNLQVAPRCKPLWHSVRYWRAIYRPKIPSPVRRVTLFSVGGATHSVYRQRQFGRLQ